MGGKPRRKPSLWVSRDDDGSELWHAEPEWDGDGWDGFGVLGMTANNAVAAHAATVLDLAPGDCIPLYAGRRRRGR